MRDAKVYIRWCYPMSETPTMLIRYWRARGWYPDDAPFPEVVGDRYGLHMNTAFKSVPLDQSFREAEPDYTEEVVIKPPRGKWRWRYGQWVK